MPKIIWTIHGAELYGERRAVESLLFAVRDAGWEVEAVSLTDGACYQSLKAAGVRTELLGFTRTPGMHLARSRVGKWWQLLKLLWHQVVVCRRLRKVFRERKPDAVHMLSVNLLPGAARAARQCGIPAFWEMTRELTTSSGSMSRRICRMLVQRLGFHTLANSRFTASTLPPLNPPAEVMLLGANASRLDPRRVAPLDRSKLRIPQDAAVFMIVARLDPIKGQEVFVRAVQEVGDPGIHVVIVGHAELAQYGQRFEAVVKELGAEKWVHLAGYTGEPEAYHAMCDVAVNARVDAESFGLSVVEAMLMGKPALVHALGGPAETVVDGQTGWHMMEATVAGYAAGIRRCLADRARWKEMGEAGRQRALRLFTTEVQQERYMAIVKEWVGK